MVAGNHRGAVTLEMVWQTLQKLSKFVTTIWPSRCTHAHLLQRRECLWPQRTPDAHVRNGHTASTESLPKRDSCIRVSEERGARLNHPGAWCSLCRGRTWPVVAARRPSGTFSMLTEVHYPVLTLQFPCVRAATASRSSQPQTQLCPPKPRRVGLFWQGRNPGTATYGSTGPPVLPTGPAGAGLLFFGCPVSPNRSDVRRQEAPCDAACSSLGATGTSAASATGVHLCP